MSDVRINASRIVPGSSGWRVLVQYHLCLSRPGHLTVWSTDIIVRRNVS